MLLFTQSVCTNAAWLYEYVQQFVIQLQFLSSFSKLLQSCIAVSPDLIGQTLKQLINALVAVLTLDTRCLGQNVKLSHTFIIALLVIVKIYFTVVAICAWQTDITDTTKKESPSKFEFPVSWHHGWCFLNVWCHKTGDALFPPSDTGTQDAACVCWTDLFMLLATVVRRDSSAAYPSVSAALGRCWRAFTGTHTFLLVCVQVTELITVLLTFDIYGCKSCIFLDRFQFKCFKIVLTYLGMKLFHFWWSPIYFRCRTVEYSFSFPVMTWQEAPATHVISV